MERTGWGGRKEEATALIEEEALVAGLGSEAGVLLQVCRQGEKCQLHVAVHVRAGLDHETGSCELPSSRSFLARAQHPSLSSLNLRAPALSPRQEARYPLTSSSCSMSSLRVFWSSVSSPLMR